MFSPDAPLRDYMLVVDAGDARGEARRSDERGSRAARRRSPVQDIPKRLGQDSLWCDYQLRIPSMPAYQQALLEWVLRYPERTQRSGDTILSFEVWLVDHASPKPGETATSDIQRRRLMEWRQPPPPPPPAPAAAGKAP